MEANARMLITHVSRHVTTDAEYLAVVGAPGGRGCVEVLVRWAGGRMTHEPTGVTYRTAREGAAAVARKNAAGAQRVR